MIFFSPHTHRYIACKNIIKTFWCLYLHHALQNNCSQNSKCCERCHLYAFEIYPKSKRRRKVSRWTFNVLKTFIKVKRIQFKTLKLRFLFDIGIEFFFFLEDYKLVKQIPQTPQSHDVEPTLSQNGIFYGILITRIRHTQNLMMRYSLSKW